MKVIKGLILFCFLGIAISACFDPPEFSNNPEIKFNKIQFKLTPSAGDFDTLILYIDFKDGDGNLGLSDAYLDEPFNDSYYYLAHGTKPDGSGEGDTIPYPTTIVYDQNGIPYILLESFGQPGKLVTDRTRLEPSYDYLPVYNENSCLNYAVTQLLVPESVVDDTYNILDTLEDNQNNLYFHVQDPFLYKANPFHNNIEVEFWVFENGQFVEFDWFEEFCISFNGRFPVLSNQTNSPLEGTIRYAMANSGFLALFSVKTLKLRVKIRDRNLNESQTIETPSFTLDGIRVN